MKSTNPRNLILTINGGSSSIKFALFLSDRSRLDRIVEGGIERIGLPDATLTVTGPNEAENSSQALAAQNHKQAVGALTDCITQWLKEHHEKSELTAIGHRIVHGGPKYSEPQRITP